MRAYHLREVKIEERDEQNLQPIQSQAIQAVVKIQYNPEEYPLITWWPLKVNIQQLKKLSAKIPKKPRFFQTIKNILQNLLYQIISLEETQIFQKKIQQFKNSISLIFLILMYVLKFQPQKRNLICSKYQQSIINQLSGGTPELLLFTERDRIILQDSIRFVTSFLFQSQFEALSNFLRSIYSICESQINIDIRGYYQNLQKTLCSNQNPLRIYFKIINKSLSHLQGDYGPSQQNSEEDQQQPQPQPQFPPKLLQNKSVIAFESQQQSKQINPIKQRKQKSKLVEGDYFLIYKAEDSTRKASYTIDHKFELKSNYKSLLPNE